MGGFEKKNSIEAKIINEQILSKNDEWIPERQEFFGVNCEYFPVRSIANKCHKKQNQ